MAFPRIGAVVFLCLLMGVFSVVGVAGTAWLGTMSIQGAGVMHADGKIIHVGPGKDFVLEQDTGGQLSFVCEGNCRASLRHLVRHLKEKAHTDVYYTQGAGRELLAIDAD